MAYETEGYEGAGHRGGHIQDDRRAGRTDVEEEPNDLDEPAGDGLEVDEELEDLGIVAGAAADDDDDDDEEKPGPLAEDIPLIPSKRAAPEASTLEQEEDFEETPGVHRSGGADVAVMSDGDRRREFPTAPKRKTRKAKVSRA